MVTSSSNECSDETFFVRLSSPSNATLAVSQGTGTILSDDTNQSALVAVTNPANRAVFADGTDITVEATARDPSRRQARAVGMGME